MVIQLIYFWSIGYTSLKCCENELGENRKGLSSRIFYFKAFVLISRVRAVYRMINPLSPSIFSKCQKFSIIDKKTSGDSHSGRRGVNLITVRMTTAPPPLPLYGCSFHLKLFIFQSFCAFLMTFWWITLLLNISFRIFSVCRKYG